MSKKYMLPTPVWSLSADELADHRSRLNAIHREMKRGGVPPVRLRFLREQASELKTKIRLAEQAGCGCAGKSRNATTKNAGAANVRPAMTTFAGGHMGGKPATNRQYSAPVPYWK